VYHNSVHFTEETNPWGFATVQNPLVFMGEYNEQKYNHGNVPVKVTGDGVEIYNDKIYLFNHSFDIDANCSQYKIEVENDEVWAYGKNMVNRTVIEFDMTKEDANAPELTMLRVIDNEKISMSVTDVNTARLEITAGDFWFDWDTGNHYKNKPTIAIFWSSDDENFQELPAVEDISKFHTGYGNFFNVSLAPLAGSGLDDGWITIKIVLTDDAGNSNVQVLEPLFYLGNLVNIDKMQVSSSKCSAYPNPFNDIITIELDNFVSGLTYFEIYDITGKIIHQQKVNSETKTFTYNGTHLKEGIYFYGIYNQGNAITGKIVKK
jgi:hypothetical protein